MSIDRTGGTPPTPSPRSKKTDQHSKESENKDTQAKPTVKPKLPPKPSNLSGQDSTALAKRRVSNTDSKKNSTPAPLNDNDKSFIPKEGAPEGAPSPPTRSTSLTRSKEMKEMEKRESTLTTCEQTIKYIEKMLEESLATNMPTDDKDQLCAIQQWLTGTRNWLKDKDIAASPHEVTATQNKLKKKTAEIACIVETTNPKQLALVVANATRHIQRNPLNIVQASKSLNKLSLQQLINLSKSTKKLTPTALQILNSKLLTQQIMSDARQEVKGLFRTVGSPTSVKTLTKAINNKQRLSHIKNRNGLAILQDTQALATYAKVQLRDVYKISGTTEQSYLNAFDKLQGPENKIILSDILDAMHVFCEESKKPPKPGAEKVSFQDVAITIGISLYGGNGSQAVTSDQNLTPEQLKAIIIKELSKDQNPVDQIESFLINWPNAKKKIFR